MTNNKKKKETASESSKQKHTSQVDSVINDVAETHIENSEAPTSGIKVNNLYIPLDIPRLSSSYLPSFSEFKEFFDFRNFVNATLESYREAINQHVQIINDQTVTIRDMQAKIKMLEDRQDAQTSQAPHQTTLFLEDKIKALEERFDQPHAQNVSSLEDKIKAIEDTVKVSKTWADVAKNPSQVISKAMEEQQKRTSKALNIRVRGVQLDNDNENILSSAQTYISTTFSLPKDAIVSAWKSKHHSSSSLCFMRFRNESLRVQVLRKRNLLKGSNQFIDEDLTPIQWTERKRLYAEAKARNQRVIFRDGRPIFIQRPTPNEEQSGVVEVPA